MITYTLAKLRLLFGKCSLSCLVASSSTTVKKIYVTVCNNIWKNDFRKHVKNVLKLWI